METQLIGNQRVGFFHFSMSFTILIFTVQKTTKFMKTGKKVKVFYTPKQVLTHDSISMSTSKSPLKPKLLMENFEKLSLTKFMDIDGTFAPYEQSEFRIAHHDSWIKTFFEGLSGRENNGIPWSKELTETVRYTNASLYNAIRHSILNPDTPCFSPTSGFHHARPSGGSGFCTFAGQVIASVKILREFGISGAYLDLDGHFGNSIEDCRGFQPELNAAVPKRPEFNFNFNPRGYNESYVNDLKGAFLKLEEAIIAGEIGYVVWCHGADSHEDDDLGGQVDTEHWVECSKLFYAWVAEMDKKLADLGRPSLPVTMSLFGGYRRDSYESVLSLHTKDMVECLNVLCGESIQYEAEVKSKNNEKWWMKDFGSRGATTSSIVKPKPMSRNEREVLEFLTEMKEEGILKYWKGKELGLEIKQWYNHSMGKWAKKLIARGKVEGSSRTGYRLK
jgi:acetoin utilization deacetylase AcuC-like enzyme